MLSKRQKNPDETLAQQNENIRLATLNLLEDLSIEKTAVENARVKEEAMILSIGDGLVATDEKENVILVNEIGAKMVGRTKEEMIGKVFFDLVTIQDEKDNIIPQSKCPVSMALASGASNDATPKKFVYYYVRKDATRFLAGITITPVVLSGKVIGTIEVFRDITKEKEIDKAKTEFVSLASHQLRTPMTAVSWYSEMLLSGDVGGVSPKQKKYMEEIYAGNKRMIVLVNTLLNVSRIELGTVLVEAKDTDVVEIARSVLEEQKLKIANKKLKVVTNFDKAIPAIFIDPKQLTMVLQNLLANAVTYTPPSGRIEISISFDGTKNLRITIADTGIGIPKNQQTKIYEKFFRADNAREADSEGTGLGLYIVKSIIENSGGKISFQSEENKGTTFYVTLPLQKKLIKNPPLG